ncbi:MAG: class I SAM-dependent methyltransferase [Acidimicrobiia bacterium]
MLQYHPTTTKETHIEPAEGASTFTATGNDYDRYMGRYSAPLAGLFADTVDLFPGIRALDLGCGPGALTGVLVDRVGTAGVSACEPSPSFAAACASRYPGVDVRAGRAEAIPFEDSRFDVAFAQLVLHFVTEPETAARELRRVLRKGGVAAACVWDFEQGMEMLRFFWDAALLVDPTAPDEATVMRFGRAGEIADLLATTGFTDITETTLTVSSVYESFDELWSGFIAGIGSAGSFCVSLDEARQASLRQILFERIGEPSGRFELSATARSASGVASN